ncbi:MAG TPA: von Willebrand factor type A domain-containing protein [Opitutaceae bacterium]|nr:von Willebrand factor type A domain-containing protein [Opitutaceae bacterium]
MPQIDQNDPRLTAYALDEMTAADRAAFEQLLRDDPIARAAVDEIRRTAESLAAALAAEPLPERSVVLATPRPHWLRRLVTDSWTLWLPLGAVACFAVFFWRVYLPDHQRRATGTTTAGVPGRPAGIPVEFADAGSAGGVGSANTEVHPRPAPPTGLTSPATTLKPAHFLTARQNPTSQFAVNVGTAGYDIVRRSVESGELPATGLVRIEEMVNYFPYRYPQPPPSDPLAVSTEMHAAPWAASHLLVRIGLQGREAPAAVAAAPAPTPVPTESPAAGRAMHAARDLLTADAADQIRAIAARDVKVQVDFNPDRVLAYRLLGYENRLVKRDDAELAAPDNDLAAGRSVTALYEIIPLPLPAPPRPAVAAKPVPPPTPDPADTAEWLTVKLRYAEPAAPQGRTVIVPLHANAPADLPPPSADFKFAAAVAGFGLMLQNNPNKGTVSWDMIEELALPGLADDSGGRRHDFVSLVKKARALDTTPTHPAEPESVPTPTSP